MRVFVLILEDLFCRKYRAEFSQAKPGQFPKLTKLERETIAFVNGEKIFVWSLYRECCNGKLPTSAKLAITAAQNQIASARH